MRNGIVLMGLLLLTGCQPVSLTTATKNEQNFWYEAGYKDATSGLIVKDNETLSEWFGNLDVDRHAYSGWIPGWSNRVVSLRQH
ncbi:hypothetical protein [Dickeya poaceiphila]|uniref:hypothetical protein n=1 Tax=Dickeya poaceiphila TaxID=568768 RepID=UPI001D13C94A|nr:hypothetical protein [Dickeya poaceiphila]